MRGYIFLTGSPRSGTTLTEKLLHNHRDVCMGSQAFPTWFIRAKEAFLREKAIPQGVYPLGHLFLERGYRPREFTEYLKGRIFESGEVAAAFREMESYKGNKTPEVQGCRDQVKDGTFYDIYRQLTDYVAVAYNKPGAAYTGNKEAFCEEYAPYFLESGAKVIIIIRDPRDVLASMNYGKGGQFTGEARPTLYVLRMWRKSVAFALAFRGHPGMLVVRYEDLARDTWRELGRISGFMGVAPYSKEQFAGGILDQKGGVWKGNSSFAVHELVDTGSIGRFREKLSTDTVRYLESVCYPELLAMGYEAEGGGFDEDAVRGFHEPFEITRDNFPPSYSSAPERLDAEVRRFRLLSSGAGEEEMREWFIFPAVYDLLKGALKGRG